MKEFCLWLLTPEAVRFAGAASAVAGRNEGGRFAVLAGHTPMLAVLAPGELRVRTKEAERTFRCGKGLLFTDGAEVKVFAESAEEIG